MLGSRHPAPLRSHVALSLAAALALAAGCGGDDDGGGDQEQPDAALDPPDAAVEICTDFAALDLGALDPIPGQAARQAANPAPPDDNPDAKTLTLQGTAANGQTPDVISIELWDGYGTFEGTDAATGTYEIAGDDTAVSSCGICVYIYSNATLVDGMIVDSEKNYIATGGTLTVDSIELNFTGSASDLTFTEIDQTSTTGSPLEGGCTTGVPSASFAAPIQVE